ncbi:hypothetical protein HOE31_01720 [bacterium]|jgi:predicted translin family RNA/ssDNA-binding protein|nr:hypothetical protein [bacterium]MBT4121648.1 hypothetical protein [bacterium]MBT4334953.1 hypothetical protein [bacterium]MBT4763788.1 hypothetical protein [bacterium]MBT5401158.1 hypothetical protein [bacterium]
MIKKTFLSQIKKDLISFNKERNEIFRETRTVLQSSKSAIFAMHRNDMAQAKKDIKNAEAILKSLNTKFKKDQRLRFEGSYRAAAEEYVEAKVFMNALTDKPIDKLPISTIGPEEYIGGLADLTGELVRQAILQSTSGDFKVLEKYKLITEEIVAFLMTLYLGGQSRHKSDDAKRNLKRLEQIIYEVNLRK